MRRAPPAAIADALHGRQAELTPCPTWGLRPRTWRARIFDYRDQGPGIAGIPSSVPAVQPTMAMVESMLERLERKVDVLIDALRVLAHGVEGGPLAEWGVQSVPRAARQAYELLL